MKQLYTTLLAGSLLVSLAGASQAGSFTYNYGENDGHPDAYTFANVSGSTYALTGSTSDINLSLNSDGPLGLIVSGAVYNVTMSLSLVVSTGDAKSFESQEFVDSYTETFVGNGGGPFANKTLLKITAGIPGLPEGAGILSADGTSPSSSGGVAGSNAVAPGLPDGVTPDNVVFSSDLFSTAGWTYQNYGDTFSLPGGSLLTYAPDPSIPPFNSLQPFIAQLSGNGGSTTPTTTPEPGSIALAFGALVSFGALRLRRRK